MKKRINLMLFLGFILSLAVYIWLLWHGGGYLPSDWWSLLALSFHAIPAFCLQLLLCRVGPLRTVKVLPLIFSVGLLLVCGCGWIAAASSSGAMLWIILFYVFIAPVAGCALAWAVYLIQKWRCSRG